MTANSEQFFLSLIGLTVVGLAVTAIGQYFGLSREVSVLLSLPPVLLVILAVAGAGYGRPGILGAQIRLWRAKSLIELVKGERDPLLTIEALNGLGVAYEWSSKFDAALAVHRKNLEVCDSALGGSHPITMVIRNNLAVVLAIKEDLVESLALFERNLSSAASFRRCDRLLLVTKHNLASTYTAVGRRQESIEILEEVLRLRRSYCGSSYRDMRMTRDALTFASKLLSRKGYPARTVYTKGGGWQSLPSLNYSH